MTDDFDFDFDLDRGRSSSRTEDREPDQPVERNGSAESSRGNGAGANGSRTDGRGLTAPPAGPAEDDWLSLGDDEFSPGYISPLRQRDDGPAGRPPPGEGRQFAKEARRRAARRPSPILDLDDGRERFGRDAAEQDVDFEELLERQPQKSRVARSGSAMRGAVRGGMANLRRVGGERLAESRDRVQALRERVPAHIPQPRPAGGAGKPPPPPRLPRRISARRPRKPQPGRVKKLRLAVVALGVGLLGIVSFFFGMMMAITQDLPKLEAKKEFATAQNSVVLDDQGNKIGTLLNNNRRILVDSGDISPYMKQAAVAIEDRRFYEHSGVDIQGLFRAGVANLIPGGSTQGGSTITEQFVKNALEAQGNRTVFQKFREAALAYQIEREWDKDKILTEYLNTIYFGEGAYGIEAAARTYFGYKHPRCGEEGADPCTKLLTPPEAALLAGIITSPSTFSPRINPQAAIDRRNLVLERMRDDGYISEAEYEQGIHDVSEIPTPSDIEQPKDDSLSPYFTSWLRQQVVDLYGPGRAFGGGLQVHSSLDLEMQDIAQEIAEGTLSGIAPTASVVVLDNETGQVKAMVGGNDYEERPFNLATNGLRQPGSAFKPFTLAAALSQGISPYTTYTSNQKIFKVPKSKNEYFEVNNYEDTYYGSSSLASCTIHSDNSCYAELALGRTVRCTSGCGGSPAVRGGTRRIARVAEEMGIETDISTNPSMVLGGFDPGVSPLEMAHAFQTIATGGERVGGNLDAELGSNDKPEDLAPVAIDKISDAKGETIAEDKPRKLRVLAPSVAETMKDILQSNVASGTGVLAQAAGNGAWGKTGTTENNGDAWFCGGTDHFTACVWVGHADSNTPMETEYNGGPVDGGTWPAYIWGRIMSAVEAIYSERKAEEAEEAEEKENSDSDSDDSDSSESSYDYDSASSGSSGSSGYSSGGGGGDSSGGGGGGGGRAPAPAPAPSGGGSTGGISGTGGTGL
jgi:penicillin-binding protein 1A